MHWFKKIINHAEKRSLVVICTDVSGIMSLPLNESKNHATFIPDRCFFR